MEEDEEEDLLKYIQETYFSQFENVSLGETDLEILNLFEILYSKIAKTENNF